VPWPPWRGGRGGGARRRLCPRRIPPPPPLPPTPPPTMPTDPATAAPDAEEELVDYEEEDAGARAGGDAGAAAAPVKKGYVGIHSSGFKDFLLKPELLRAIVDCGFEHPSEGGGREGDRRGGALAAVRPAPPATLPPPHPPQCNMSASLKPSWAWTSSARPSRAWARPRSLSSPSCNNSSRWTARWAPSSSATRASWRTRWGEGWEGGVGGRGRPGWGSTGVPPPAIPSIPPPRSPAPPSDLPRV